MTEHHDDRDDVSTTAADDLSYGAAMDELESVLTRLTDERLDIDDVTVLVERAAVLVRSCRTRLDAARLRVEEIVDDLQSGR
ncbi:MAG: exodeoxyribonuclease VII small subunit [Microthrixaceae bacterium]